MIALQLAGERVIAAKYLVAGKIIAADRRIEALEHLAVDAPEGHTMPPLRFSSTSSPETPTFAGEGWISNGWRQVRCTAVNDGYHLQVDGVGRFAVAPSGDAVICLQDTTNPGSSLLVETILGAPLILALAQQDVWCLHASAVTDDDGRLLVFLGESGKGKSTLAKSLPALPSAAWRWACDDILPITLSQDALVGLPHFPQLKLALEEQLERGEPQSPRLKAIYLLQDAPPHASVTTERLNQRAAFLALVGHSVASRLFSQKALAEHIDFCTAAAARIPVFSLVYPHRPGSIVQVAAQIRSDMDGGC